MMGEQPGIVLVVAVCDDGVGRVNHIGQEAKFVGKFILDGLIIRTIRITE